MRRAFPGAEPSHSWSISSSAVATAPTGANNIASTCRSRRPGTRTGIPTRQGASRPASGPDANNTGGGDTSRDDVAEGTGWPPEPFISSTVTSPSARKRIPEF